MPLGRTLKIHKLTVDIEMLEMFAQLPLSRSAAIGQSIMKVARKPDLLHMALRYRMSETRSGNKVCVSYTRDPKLGPMIDKLTEITDLSGEQVIRLCMEAYIHKLN